MKRLLVVVDYQKDFVDGALGFPGAEQLEERICQKVRAYRETGDTIAFTYDTHDTDYLGTQEGKLLPVPHCVRGSDGWKLFGAVDSCCMEEDPAFYKSAFGSIALMEYVRKEAFEQVELCGLVSNICVISNAVLVKAALPEAFLHVDALCVGGGDQLLHEKALDVMEGLQILVENRSK